MKKFFFPFCLFLSMSLQGYSQSDPFSKLQKPLSLLPPASLEEVEMHVDSLNKGLGILRSSEHPDFRGLVVIKDHKLVVEEYFYTYWRATIHDIRSAGKSVTALLLGIAIDQGLIEDVNQPIYSFFPSHKVHIPLTETHKSITIAHLLQMSSGMNADADDIETPGNGIHLIGSEDWLDLALNLPIAFTPGERWVYNDVCAMLTGAIVQSVSGKNLSEFAKTYLFDPLDFDEYYWYTGPQNITGAMGNLYLTTLDFAKLGQLIVNEGKWEGKQIISPEWIEELQVKRLEMPSDFLATHYGYFWYFGEKEINGKTYKYMYASGSGGNKLYVVPDQNLVVAATSSAYGRGYGHGRAESIFTYILKSLVQP
ncbi:MAG: serine hydrolase [Bacteroidota bacterium]